MYSLQCWRTVHRPTYILSTDLPYPILRLSASTSRQNCALKSHFPSAANHQQLSLNLPTDVIIIIVIYSLIARVVGAPQMISQPRSSIFLCSSLPSGTLRLQGQSNPWCYLLTSSSVHLVFSSLSLCRAWWFGPDLMNGRHVHATAVGVSLPWAVHWRLMRAIAHTVALTVDSGENPSLHWGIHRNRRWTNCVTSSPDLCFAMLPASLIQLIETVGSWEITGLTSHSNSQCAELARAACLSDVRTTAACLSDVRTTAACLSDVRTTVACLSYVRTTAACLSDVRTTAACSRRPMSKIKEISSDR